MLISYFRRGRYPRLTETAAEPPCAQGTAVAPTFQTRIDSTGSSRNQLLLDYEEDQICVVRHIRRNGSIGGYRLWPRAEDPECAETDCSDDCA